MNKCSLSFTVLLVRPLRTERLDGHELVCFQRQQGQRVTLRATSLTRGAGGRQPRGAGACELERTGAASFREKEPLQPGPSVSFERRVCLIQIQPLPPSPDSRTDSFIPKPRVFMALKTFFIVIFIPKTGLKA